jgi:beta-lactamase class A
MPPSLLRRFVLASPFLATTAWASDAAAELAELERKNGGRLGVAALDTATGRQVGHRSDERFALCSTFKVLAAGLVLSRVDRGEERLDRRVVFGAGDLVTYSPVTERHTGAPGLTMAEICAAGIALSDNTAGNLMLSSFGGPAALTTYARSLGDDITRLDRTETTLNEAKPGDPRDTTSPAAMVGDMRRLLAGNALSPQSRDRLIDWLVASKTGGQRLRAGFPAAWRVGDKTGTGANGAANDVAIAFPPGRGPILTAVYFTGAMISDEARSAVIADAGRIVASALA